MIRGFACLVLLSAAGCSAGPAPPASAGAAGGVAAPAALAAETAEELLPLPAPGESVQRRLEPGEVHLYPVTVAAGWLLSGVVWEQGSDLAVRLLGPGGKLLSETTFPGTRPGALLLEALLEEPGEYRLAISPAAPDARPGLYRLRLEALRPAIAEEADASRPAVRRRLDEALLLLQEDREGATRQAIELCQQDLQTSTPGRESWIEAWTLHNLGRLQKNLQEWEAADRSLAAAAEAFGRLGDRYGQARAWLEWSWALYKRQEFAVAERVLQGSLEVFVEEGDRLGEAAVLNDLGLLCRVLPECSEEPRSYLLRALEIRRREGDRVGQAETLLNLGNGERNTQTQLDYYAEAEDLARAEGDQNLLAAVLISQGPLQRRLGRLQQALDSYVEARPLVQRTGNRELLAKLSNYLAIWYQHLGDYDRSAEEYEVSLALAREVGDRSLEQTLLGHLAWLQYFRERLPEALELYDQSLHLARQSDDQKSLSSRAFAFYGRGAARAALGQRTDALADLQDSLDLYRQLADAVAEAHTLSYLGEILQEEGDLDAAEKALARGREISSAVGDGLLEAVTLKRLARVEEARGDLVTAVALFNEALEIFEQQRDTLLIRELRDSLLAARRPAYEEYVGLLLQLARQRPGGGFDGEALLASERARARGLVELLAEARVDLRQHLDSGLQRRQEDLEEAAATLRQRARSMVPAVEGSGALEALRAQQQELRDQQALLQAQIRKQDPRYAELVYPAPLGPEQIQSLLAEDMALLEYLLGEEAVYLFIVTRQRLTALTLDVAPQRITALVDELRQSLQMHNVFGDLGYTRAAGELFEHLIAPAEPLLDGKTHLLIAPDGKLYHLPFEALLTRRFAGGQQDLRSAPYLIHRYSVSYIPSVSVLAGLVDGRAGEAAPSGPGPLEFLAFADPVYGQTEEDNSVGLDGASRGDPRFPRLVASGREVESIAGLFGPGETRIFLRSAASEANLKRDPDLARATRLHFAAHGVVDEEDPGNTALVLTLDEDGEDGYLHLGEIFDLRLSADLVVLSACSTGLGKEMRGEGLIGLSRAFMYAGAASLVVSLWRVEDEASADLMLHFYRGLLAGEDRSAALRRAKLQALEDERPARFHPSQWAPFVLLGKRE